MSSVEQIVFLPLHTLQVQYHFPTELVLLQCQYAFLWEWCSLFYFALMHIFTNFTNLHHNEIKRKTEGTTKRPGFSFLEKQGILNTA